MNTLKDLFIFLERYMRKGCICIETGIQHDFDEKNKDYYSTTNIVKWICKPKNGILYSFDIEQKFTDVCKRELGEDEKYINFIVGNSIENLKNIISDIGNKGGIDFVFLDSKEFDEEHMLNEFKIIIPFLKRGSVICCDDILNPSSVKWKRAVPYIKNSELIDFWFEYTTPTGLFVGIKN